MFNSLIRVMVYVTHRSRTEIFGEILEILREGRSDGRNGGVTKATIMQRAFLSHAQMKVCLKILIDNDLISYDRETMGFKLTEKGHGMCDAFNHLIQLFPEERQQEQRRQKQI